MKYLYRCLLMVAAVALLGCNEEKEFDAWVASAEEAKISAEREIDILPYRQEQHLAFKTYFERPLALIAQLESDDDFRGKFNSILAKREMDQVCGRALFPFDRWNALIENCTKNRYFLCALEVQEYQSAIQDLREFLNPEQLTRFKEAPSCQAVVQNSDG